MPTMYVAPDASKKAMPGLEGAAQPVIHKIRITLSSLSVEKLLKVCNQLTERARDQQLPCRGPVPLPTKKLNITTRKTPCGEGSKTWDRCEMRIHKRILDIYTAAELVKQLTSITVEPGVEVEVTMAD
jgi:small subunit ribosomal protein S20e